MNPELLSALASDPIYNCSPSPPRGVPFHEYVQRQAEVMLSPWTEHFKALLPPVDEYSVSDNTIPLENGEITIRCLTPATSSTYPVLVWFHRGGWVSGNIDLDDNYLRTLCVELQLAIVNVGYRLAPHVQYPVPFMDCYSSLKWVADNTYSLHINLAKGFLVGGDGVGGNLAAAVALKARGDPFFATKPLTGQFLREPMVVCPNYMPVGLKPKPSSWDLNANVQLFNRERVLKSSREYRARPGDPRMSPLLVARHSGLPPAFVQVMQMDPLRDDGAVYEQVLREAGVETRLVEYPGFLHGAHYSFPGLEMSKAIDRDGRDGLKWLLSLTGYQTTAPDDLSEASSVDLSYGDATSSSSARADTALLSTSYMFSWVYATAQRVSRWWTGHT